MPVLRKSERFFFFQGNNFLFRGDNLSYGKDKGNF